MKTLIGIDIGGTKCSVVRGCEKENGLSVLKKSSFSTADYLSAEKALEKCCSEIEAMDDGHPIAGIGISCGGPLDSAMGVILSPPNLPGWDNIAICDYFQSKFHVPTFLRNDADAWALAEWRFGAGRGSENFVFLTCGTGLGAGLILGGRLHTGRQNMAGELGHWRMHKFGPVGYGKVGSLEGFCSGGGIAQLAQQSLLELKQNGGAHPFLNQNKAPTARDVFLLARENDPMCRKIIEDVGVVLGCAFAMIIDLLNPEIIVAGSIFTRNYDYLYPIVRPVVEAEALPLSVSGCCILPSELGESIGDMAALTAALQGE